MCVVCVFNLLNFIVGVVESVLIIDDVDDSMESFENGFTDDQIIRQNVCICKCVVIYFWEGFRPSNSQLNTVSH